MNVPCWNLKRIDDACLQSHNVIAYGPINDYLEQIQIHVQWSGGDAGPVPWSLIALFFFQKPRINGYKVGRLSTRVLNLNTLQQIV